MSWVSLSFWIRKQTFWKQTWGHRWQISKAHPINQLHRQTLPIDHCIPFSQIPAPHSTPRSLCQSFMFIEHLRWSLFTSLGSSLCSENSIERSRYHIGIEPMMPATGWVPSDYHLTALKLCLLNGEGHLLRVDRKIGIMYAKCSESHLAHSRHIINGSCHNHVIILRLLTLMIELMMTFPLKEG